MKTALAFGVLLAGATASGPKHFDVAASFVPPAKPGGPVAVSVLFSPNDPDVHINEEPAPRLKLDPAQVVLVDKQPPLPPRPADFDPDQTRYLDLARPVRFPVGLAAKAPKGPQALKATVVYYYCSKREGWCRRGSADLQFNVDVP